MSEDGTESNKQTLDLVIVNSSILTFGDEEMIKWDISDYGFDINVNVAIREDMWLHYFPTFERFPKDAVIYTHLAPNSSPAFITLAGVYELTEVPALKAYRSDLRFIVTIDNMCLVENKFFRLWKGDSMLFDFLQKISKQELDPANVVSCTFERGWNTFFSNEKEDYWRDNFKDYVEKLLALRAEQEKQTNKTQEGN